MPPRRVGKPSMALVRRCLLLSLFVSVVARQKSNKEWGQMSDKDWDRVAEEWEDDEEKEEYAYKPPKPKGLDMDKLQKFKGDPKVPAGRHCLPTRWPPLPPPPLSAIAEDASDDRRVAADGRADDDVRDGRLRGLLCQGGDGEDGEQVELTALLHGHGRASVSCPA